MTDVFFAIHVYHNEKIFCKNFSWMPICSLCYSGEAGEGGGGGGVYEDDEECAPDLYSELKAIVDIGAMASCG